METVVCTRLIYHVFILPRGMRTVLIKESSPTLGLVCACGKCKDTAVQALHAADRERIHSSNCMPEHDNL
jgi:hypothetical protein